MDWNTLLLDQLTFHWDHQVRPALDDLTDEEYLWEPVAGMWSIRPRAQARGTMAAGGGELVADFEFPEPSPPPVTTIAWRLAHVSVGVFGMRNASHFGAPPVDYWTVDWPGTARSALDLLDQVYADWIAGVRTLDEARLAEPVGKGEGPYADLPYAALVLHIHREAIHHLAEESLLRDLHRAGLVAPATV